MATPELPPAPPAKPLEDISPYIKLNGIVRSSDGTPEAGIWDISSNKYYAIRLKSSGEKSEVDVRKYYFLNNQRKPLESGNELVISEEFTSTNRTFKVNGFYEDGMVLTETIVPAKPAEAVAKGPPPNRLVEGMETRLASETASVKEIYFMLFKSPREGEEWARLRGIAWEWLTNRVFHTVSLIFIGSQAGDWTAPSYETSEEPGRFRCMYR